MSRAIAEQSNAFKIFFLKKHGYLNKAYSYISGGISWSFGYSENKSGINYSVHRDNWGTDREEAYVRLKYIHTNRWTGEKSDMDYKIPLTTTPCYFGGVRYWFVCPLSNNGRYCGRRVGVLYSIGKWFGCRHCGRIAYQAQFKSGRFGRSSVCEPDVERAHKEAKRKYYNGQITRKYRRYLRMRNKMDNAWIDIAEKLCAKL